MREKCRNAAFDTYSHLLELAVLVNKYAAEQTSRNIQPPHSWQEFVFNLERAFEWIEREHSAEIYVKQLSLL